MDKEAGLGLTYRAKMMARRNPRKKAEMIKDDVTEENVESDTSDAPSEPTPSRATKKVKKGSKVVPIQEALVTCERFARGKGDLGNIYAQMVRMENGGKVSKRTVKEWTSLYGKWLKAPRG